MSKKSIIVPFCYFANDKICCEMKLEVFTYVKIRIDVNFILGLLHRVVGHDTDISEVHVASIFRVEISKIRICIFWVMQ
jgi:hypothetical protein